MILLAFTTMEELAPNGRIKHGLSSRLQPMFF